jgi:predicted lactoylglutathione lyase
MQGGATNKKEVMKLVVETPAPNLDRSIAFYTSLGFERRGPYFSDGQCALEVNPTKSARPGFKFYKYSWEEWLGSHSADFSIKKVEDRHVLMDPSGVYISLIEGERPSEAHEITKEEGLLGTYAGISIETVSIQRSVDFYTAFGFTINMGHADQGWITLENTDGTVLSLMEVGSCPHSFANPSLTYFNGGKNLSVIEKIRQSGVAFFEEVNIFNKEGIVDNVILRDPGGLGIFVFND